MRMKLDLRSILFAGAALALPLASCATTKDATESGLSGAAKELEKAPDDAKKNADYPWRYCAAHGALTRCGSFSSLRLEMNAPKIALPLVTLVLSCAPTHSAERPAPAASPALQQKAPSSTPKPDDRPKEKPKKQE